MRWSPYVVVATALALAAAGGVTFTVLDHDENGSGSPPSAIAPTRPPVLADLPDTAPAAPAAVEAALRRATRDVAFGGSLVGVVVDHDSGSTLFARQADRALPPASTVKLLTAAVALDTLGPDASLTTEVVRLGRTLYLVGGGDMTLTARQEPGYPSTATMHQLAADTAAAVSATVGDHPVRVRYDDTAWTGPDLAAGWSTGYFTAGDVSHLSPLEVDGGRVDHGEPLRVADPPAQAATVFADELERRGLDVTGTPAPAPAPSSASDVASVSSPPLAALVQRMLTVSDNDLAESLGRILADHAGLPATFTGAARAVRAGLVDLDAPVTGLRLRDASGLSHLDRVTPRTLAAVVRSVTSGSERLESVAQGLPIAGLTGTLSDRYRHGPALAGAGVVRAKTGTLAGVSALAGQLVDADGGLLDFAFLTDRAALPGPAEAGLDRLAAALAGCHCSSGAPPGTTGAAAGSAT